MTHTLRALQSEDEFPAWDPNEIEGWDEMSPEDQKEVKDMYDALKELFDSLEELAAAFDEPQRRRLVK